MIHWEQWYPRLGAIFAGLAAFYWLPDYLALAIREELLKDATALGAVIVGFLAASQAVLATVITSDIVQRLKAAGGYEHLVSYFGEGIAIGFVLVLISAILRLPPTDDPSWWFALAPVWISIATWTALATYRIIRIFSKILAKL